MAVGCSAVVSVVAVGMSAVADRLAVARQEAELLAVGLAVAVVSVAVSVGLAVGCSSVVELVATVGHMVAAVWASTE